MNKQTPLFSDLPEPAQGAREDSPLGGSPPPRVLYPVRNQLELRPMELDATLGPEHPARAVWAFVESLDLTGLYAQVASVEGRAGRPAIDPGILVALWLYATTQAVGSARTLGRLCEQHDAYRWICGGVSVNYHTLSDFRVEHAGWLDEQLSRSVAALMQAGVVELKRVARGTECGCARAQGLPRSGVPRR